MRKILKYEILISDKESTPLPSIVNKILYAGEQNDKLYLWCETDDSDIQKTFGGIRSIIVHGTGHNIPSTDKYLFTVQIGYGLVWHLFEI